MALNKLITAEESIGINNSESTLNKDTNSLLKTINTVSPLIFIDGSAEGLTTSKACNLTLKLNDLSKVDLRSNPCAIILCLYDIYDGSRITIADKLGSQLLSTVKPSGSHVLAIFLRGISSSIYNLG